MQVTDASVAAKLIFPETHSDRATQLFNDEVAHGRHLLAPSLLAVEVTNIVRKRMRRDRFSLAHANSLLDDFFDLPITLFDPPRLHHHALALASAYSLGVHDAHYVVLGESLQRDVWTDDQRLLRAVAGRLPFIRWIGDYPMPLSTT